MLLRFNYKIRYQDVDCYRTIKPSVLEEYLLESAGNAANMLGIGYHEMLARDMAWVLIRLSIEMDSMPMIEEELVIETWISSFAHGLSPRYFIIKKLTPTGELEIGRAGSIWTVLNLKTRQMESIFDEEIFSTIELHDALPMSIPRLRTFTEPDSVITRSISYSDLDYNNHCNSCKYLEMMIDANPSLMGLDNAFTININYNHELHCGEVVDIAYRQAEDAIIYCARRHEDNTIAVMAEVKKRTVVPKEEVPAISADATTPTTDSDESAKRKPLEPVLLKRPTELECDVVRFQNNKDKWIAFVGLLDGRPYEIFTGLADDEDGILIPKSVSKGKIIKTVLEDGQKRYDFQYVNTRGFKTTVEGLSYKFDKEYWNYAKLISGVLRYGMPLDQVVKMINGLQMDSESINSWKTGVERALKKYIQDPEG